MPEFVQHIRDECTGEGGMLEIQAVGVEFGNGRCAYHYTGRVAVFEDIQG